MQITITKNGEATQLSLNGHSLLFSYETLVGVYCQGDAFAWVTRDGKANSRTTGKHISQWLSDLGVTDKIITSAERLAIKSMEFTK